MQEVLRGIDELLPGVDATLAVSVFGVVLVGIPEKPGEVVDAPDVPGLVGFVDYCVIRPEQRSNKRLKGQDGKSLLRLKRGFRPISAFEYSGSLHDMYIRAGVSLRLEENHKSPSTAYRPPHKDGLPRVVGTDSTQDISLSVVIPTTRLQFL